MTALLTILLIISILGIMAVIYSVRDAWKTFLVAAKSNGWILLSARGMLRSQIFRLAEIALLASAVGLGMYYPAPDRPEWATVVLRFLIIVPIALISINAILDALASRKVLRSK